MGVCPLCYGAGTRLDAGSSTSRVTCSHCFGSGSNGNRGGDNRYSGDPVSSLIAYFSLLPMVYAGMLSQQNNVESWDIAILCFVAYVTSILICNFTPIRWIFSTVVFAFGLSAFLVIAGIVGAGLLALADVFIF